MDNAQPPPQLDVHPKTIQGNWHDGYALDAHTIDSVPIGFNEYGHTQFDTTRTPLGELIYQLKYRHDRSAIDPIVRAVVNFLNSWSPPVDAIVPIPPSSAARRIQPVIEVAREVSRIKGIALCETCVRKVKVTKLLKNVPDFQEKKTLLEGAFTADREKTSERRILLFDDLYDSGATAIEITRVLMIEGGAASVYFLALTRTGRRS